MSLGTLADWVIAAANVCMARVAYTALDKTKDFFKHKMNEEDINIILDINSIVADIASDITILHQIYAEMIIEWHSIGDAFLLKNRYCHVTNILMKIISSITKCDELKYRLEYKKIKYEKVNKFNKLIKSMQEFRSAITPQIDSIKTILSAHYQKSDYPEDVKNRFINSANEKLKDPYKINFDLQEIYSLLHDFGIDIHQEMSLNTDSGN
ncbi:hypothetical protein ACIPT2_09540 [Pectobacterium brasiliense]|uniref:hypothetical protein n=1 Tax=Pectobacterium brasiliense TaxID=180957 RepID=UPI00381B6150